MISNRYRACAELQIAVGHIRECRQATGANATFACDVAQAMAKRKDIVGPHATVRSGSYPAAGAKSREMTSTLYLADYELPGYGGQHTGGNTRVTRVLGCIGRCKSIQPPDGLFKELAIASRCKGMNCCHELATVAAHSMPMPHFIALISRLIEIAFFFLACRPELPDWARRHWRHLRKTEGSLLPTAAPEELCPADRRDQLAAAEARNGADERLDARSGRPDRHHSGSFAPAAEIARTACID